MPSLRLTQSDNGSGKSRSPLWKSPLLVKLSEQQEVVSLVPRQPRTNVPAFRKRDRLGEGFLTRAEQVLVSARSGVQDVDE